MVEYLVKELKMNANQQDNYGDTPLHDAAKFGHDAVVKILLEGGADGTIKNKMGLDPLAVAKEHEKPVAIKLISSQQHSKL